MRKVIMLKLWHMMLVVLESYMHSWARSPNMGGSNIVFSICASLKPLSQLHQD